MGKILIGKPGNLRQFELMETTLVGRHWQCNAVISNIEVPLYWLEIRWLSDHWTWRCLSSTDRTRGSGTVTSNGWRDWRSKNSIAPTISLPTGASIELIDPSPPTFQLQDQYTGEQFKDDALLDLVELTNDGYILYDAEREDGQDGQDAKFLQDGALLHIKGRILRVWRPKGPQPTKVPLISLSASGLFLTIDCELLTATFTQHDAEVTIEGSPVRLLLTYAQSVVDGPWVESDSFLATSVAFDGWLSNGGHADSEPKRLAWERAKLRSLLVKAGVVGVNNLFERRRDGASWSHRLCLSPAMITII